MTRFADVVSASHGVTGTTSRSRKIAILAAALRALEASEVAICVGFLSGVPRQGRIGVGNSTIRGIDQRPAGATSLTVADVDRALSDLEAATGSGAATRRRRLLCPATSRRWQRSR
jgi:DNA ligase-1